jgi:hypothetical protein
MDAIALKLVRGLFQVITSDNICHIKSPPEA